MSDEVVCVYLIELIVAGLVINLASLVLQIGARERMEVVRVQVRGTSSYLVKFIVAGLIINLASLVLQMRVLK